MGCAAFPKEETAQQPRQATSNEDFATTALALAELCQIRGDLDEAAEHCQAVIKVDPRRADAYHRLAIIEAKQEQFDKSFTSFTRALRLSPHDPKLLSDLGYALYLDDRFEMAEKALRKAIKLDPTLAAAKNHLATVLEQENQLEEVVVSQELVSDDNDEVASPESESPQLSMDDEVEDRGDLPNIDAEAADVDPSVKVVEEVALQVLPQASASGNIDPVEYVQTASSRSSGEDVTAENESDAPRSADLAIFHDSPDGEATKLNSNEEATVQPATYSEPVTKRRASPMSDLSKAMTLLENRRSRGSSHAGEQQVAETRKPIELHDASRPIRLNLAPRPTRQNNHTTLNIVDP